MVTALRSSIAGALALAFLLPTAPVSAQEEPANHLIIGPSGDRSSPSFFFGPGNSGVECEDPTSVLTNDDDEAIDTTELTTFDGPASGTIDLGELPAGFFTLTVVCHGQQEGDEYLSDSVAFGRLTVTKTVTGSPPVDAAFTVRVTCDDGGVDPGGDPFTEDLVFGRNGGTEPIILYNQAICTITEPEDGGATAVVIAPGSVDFVLSGPVDTVSTVVNEFPAVANRPDPAPVPEPAPASATASAAAVPVVAQPSFTG